MVTITAGALAQVTYLTGVNADGTLSSTNYWTERDGETARKWGAPTAGTGATISYSFDAASGWSSTERNTFRMALELVEAVADVNFVFESNPANANIVLNRDGQGRAFASTPVSDGSGSILGTPSGQGSISIDPSSPGFEMGGDFDVSAGFGISTVLHEILHAVGLGHGGNYNNNVNSATQQESLYDTKLYTTMSYIYGSDSGALYFDDYVVTGTSWDANNNSSTARASHTWMMLDILALQRLYGEADNSVFSGGQTFGFGTTITGLLRPYYDFTVNTSPVITIYSQGGGNTLDLSGFDLVGSTVNLDDGAFSSANGLTNNIGIAYGTIVTHVRTGDAGDDITGNENNNTFEAGGGNNTIRGLQGDDTLIGGVGVDAFDGGEGIDTVDHRPATSPITIDLVAGTAGGDTATLDTYISVERILAGRENDTLTGRDDADETFFGYGGNDDLNGGGGNDWLAGGLGGDALNGGAGNDLLYGGSAVPNLIRNGAFDMYAGALVFGVNGSSGDVPFVEGWGDFAQEDHEFVRGVSLSGDRTDYVFDLESSGNRNIFQKVSTVLDNVTYRLSFDFRKLSDAASAQVRVSWGDLLLETITSATTTWQTFSINITGGQGDGGQENVLYFEEIGALDGFGMLLDSVRIWRDDGSIFAGDDPILDGGDTIHAGTGSDTVYGDGGDDIVVFEDPLDTPIDYAYGGFGTDLLRMDWLGATARIIHTAYTGVGGNGTGEVRGSLASYKTGDHDLYFAEFERYELTGGTNNDELVGGDLNDILRGGDGNDTLSSGFGVDEINGGDGDDHAILKLEVVEAIDRAAAASATGFTLSNGTRLISIESISIEAGDGDDTYDVRGSRSPGETGPAYFNGGGGNDTFKVDLANSDTSYFDGGAGIDTYVIDWSAATTDITFFTPLGTVNGSFQYGFRTGPIPGTANSTYMADMIAVERMELRAGSGDDVLEGLVEGMLQLGSDTINPGTGRDEIDFKSGSDTLVLDWNHVARDIVYGTASKPWHGGYPEIIRSIPPVKHTGDLATGYTGAFGFWADDYLNGQEDRVDFTGAEQFHLTLGAGMDVIATGDGDDTIIGNGGGDWYDTGKGLDNVDGGDGNAQWQADKSDMTVGITLDLTNSDPAAIQSTYTLYLLDGPSATVKGIGALGYIDDEPLQNGDASSAFRTGSGDDTLRLKLNSDNYVATGAGDDVVRVYYGYTKAELGADSDKLILDYSFGAQRLEGSVSGSLANGHSGFIGGSFTLFGSTFRWGSDFTGVESFEIYAGSQGSDITTGDGADSLAGGSGADRFSGGGGADTMTGGGGLDSLMGGAGGDTFRFSSRGSSTVDTVLDYSFAQGDKIDLAPLAASGTWSASSRPLSSVVKVEHAGSAAGLFVDISLNSTPSWSKVADLSGLIVGQQVQLELNAQSATIFVTSLVPSTPSTNINGGTGDDFLLGGPGVEILNGEAGFDFAVYSSATGGITVNLANPAASTGEAAGDTFISIEGLRGGNFADTLIGNELDNGLRGGLGDDRMTGGLGVDRFAADAGADTITDLGLGGADALEISAGAIANATLAASWTATAASSNAGIANLVAGGFGVDVALATGGNGWSVTNAGNATGIRFSGSLNADTLTGGEGGDTLLGGAGNDMLRGFGGNDSLSGGGGNDSMIGGDGFDGLFGGTGNDFLDGGAENDVMDGDADNDTLIGSGGADELRGGVGIDFASFQTALNVGVIVSLVTGIVGAGGDATGDTFFDIEGFIGSNFNDTLYGNTGANILDGSAGNDLMDGDADNDTLIGSGGADELRGGDGIDFASYQTALNVGVVVSLVAGIVGSGGDAEGDIFNSIEGLIGSSFNDILYGNTGANTLEGGDGFDVVFGDGGGGVGDADIIRLGEGNDAAAGEDGNDTIFGGNGTEYLYGGKGVDVLWGEDGVDFLFGEEDSDVLYGGNSTDGLIGGAGIDYLFGQTGTDYLYGGNDTDFLYGGDDFDFIYGGDGVDALFGEGGGDLLAGEGSTDYIAGGEGDDYIFGGDGVDFMYGEGGNDVFTGGLGAPDAFYHQAVTGGNDQITDFEVARDVLVLLGTGYASSAEALANASFTANGASLATGAGTSVLLIGISIAELNAGNVFIG